MTGRPKGVSRTSGAGANQQTSSMTAFNAAAMEIFAEACQTYAKGIYALNEELMGFINDRLNRDVELSRALCKCTDWSDATKLQQHWAQQTTREYLAEAGKITELAAKVAKESWEPVYDRASKALNEASRSVS